MCGYFIPNNAGTVNGYGLHMTVEPVSPTIEVVTSDSPVDCSLNVPLELGIFGRPN